MVLALVLALSKRLQHSGILYDWSEARIMVNRKTKCMRQIFAKYESIDMMPTLEDVHESPAGGV